MLEEDLDERFKDPADSFRLVFVCAMWMTGFDVPSCSTIYLDRPMRNHTLMQTIARANRVFPDKENGLIVDYVGVFRHLEAALAVYAAGPPGPTARTSSATSRRSSPSSRTRSPSSPTTARGGTSTSMRSRAPTASSSSRCATPRWRRCSIDDVTRRGYLERSGRVRRLFSAILPDPAASAHVRVVGVARNLAEKIRSLDVAPDLASVSGAVRDLLDRSVGAEEYVIRAAADGSDADAEALIDLNAIDFEALAARLAGRKRSSVRRLAGQLAARADLAARRNPARLGSGAAPARAHRRLQRGLAERRRDAAPSAIAHAAALRGRAAHGARRPDGARARRLRPADPARSCSRGRTARRGQGCRAQAHGAHRGAPRARLAQEGADARGGAWVGHGHPRGAARRVRPTTWQRKADIVFNHIFASYYDDGSSVYDDAAR